MNHYIAEIRENPHSLNDTVSKHISECRKCRAEWNALTTIERSVAELPIRRVPAALKVNLFARIMAPAYRIWHLLATVFFLILSPVVISYRVESIESAGISVMGLALLFAVYGILLTTILFALSFLLFGRYGHRLEDFKHRVDDLIEHSRK